MKSSGIQMILYNDVDDEFGSGFVRRKRVGCYFNRIVSTRPG
jgi:hypothetical protein